jgi:hypothetical protein
MEAFRKSVRHLIFRKVITVTYRIYILEYYVQWVTIVRFVNSHIHISMIPTRVLIVETTVVKCLS